MRGRHLTHGHDHSSTHGMMDANLRAMFAKQGGGGPAASAPKPKPMGGFKAGSVVLKKGPAERGSISLPKAKGAGGLAKKLTAPTAEHISAPGKFKAPKAAPKAGHAAKKPGGHKGGHSGHHAPEKMAAHIGKSFGRIKEAGKGVAKSAEAATGTKSVNKNVEASIEGGHGRNI